jgi:PAS domain S-box-containing protein
VTRRQHEAGRHPGQPRDPPPQGVDGAFEHGSEDAASAIDEHHRLMTESMPHKVFTAAADGAVDYINSQWITFTGLPFEEIRGWGWAQCVHPDDVQETVRRWQSSIATGEPFAFQHRLRRSDGVYRWHFTCAQPVTGIDGQTRMWVGSGTDIDDHKRIEHDQRILVELSELLVARSTYRDMLRCIAEFLVPEIADVCFIDDVMPGGSVRRLEAVFADPALSALVELAAQFVPRLGGCTAQDRALATGQVVWFANISDRELRDIAHEDHHVKFVKAFCPRSMIVFPLPAHGQMLGLLTLATAGSNRVYGPSDLQLGHQIAHLAALAVDSARLHEDTQRTTQASRDAIATVSHDLRTPLNVISMSLMAMQGTDDHHSRRPIESIQRAAERMNQLVGELLDSASIDADRLVLDRRHVSVAPFVRDTVEILQPLCTTKHLLLTCELPPRLPTIFADLDRLQRVLSNVIDNAIKFTADGGAILIRAAPAGAFVEFSIADTGTGIAPEDLPHVFERFWQAGRAGRRGTGLGLAIAKGIVEAHGGRIWVHSHPGTGSTFHFTVPVAGG